MHDSHRDRLWCAPFSAIADCAWASPIMVGSLFAGADESPGVAMIRNDRRYKIVRGMASLSANIDRRMLEKGELAVEQLWQVVEFIRITHSGMQASCPHNVE